MAGEMFDSDYFIRGKQTGKSLYEDYRWLPELTIPMAKAVVKHCGIRPEHNVLDFGCARGYLVRAMYELGYDAWGYDISQWALGNADESIRHRLIINESTLYAASFDWVLAKDVLEHIDTVERSIDLLMDVARVGVFAVVPLAHGTTYDVPEYEADMTHVHRRTLRWWVGRFHRPGWSVEARYRVSGVKDNYAQYPTGNGFITCRRLSDW